VVQARAPERRQPTFMSAAWTYSKLPSVVLPVRAESEIRGEAPQVENDEIESAGFVGLWGPDASACSPRTNRSGLLPAVIHSEGAWAGETSCRFERLKRTAAGWQSVARCARGEERWNSKVRLTLSGDHLVWASERGSQNYVRCGQALL
jgi:hypothetical protein